MPKYELFSKFNYSDLLGEIQKYYVSEIGNHAEERLKTAERLAKELYYGAPKNKSTKSLKCVSQALIVFESAISASLGICEKLPYRYFERRGGCDHTAVRETADMIESVVGKTEYWPSKIEEASNEFHKNLRNEITAFYYLHGDQLFKAYLGNKDAYVIVIMNAAYKLAERLDNDMMPDVDVGCAAVAVAAETTRYLSGMKRMETRQKKKRGKVPDDRKYMFLKSIGDFSVFTNDDGMKYSEPEKLEKLRTAIRPKVEEIAEDDEFEKILAYMDQIQINYLKDLKDFRIMKEDISQAPNGIYSMIERLNKGKRLPKFPE